METSYESTLRQVIRRISEVSAFPDLLSGVIGDDAKFLYKLASALRDRGTFDVTLDIYELIRIVEPENLSATLDAVRLLSEGGRVEEALELLLAARAQGMAGAEIADSIQRRLFDAAHAHGLCVASGDFDRALKICELLVKLCPDAPLFRRARLDTMAALQRRHSESATEFALEHYHGLCELAGRSFEKRDSETELQCRLESFRHPLDRVHHSLARVTNIAFALSRVLSVDVEVIDTQRRALAQELLTGLRATPTSHATPGNADEQAAASWERAMRLLLGTIDLQAVFERPTEVTPPLATNFVSTAGVALEIAEIVARARERDAKALFVTSASAEYFERHAPTYISSILNSCDCECMVFVYLCLPKTVLTECAAGVGIDDPRVIYCSGDFDPAARTWRLIRLARHEPLDMPGIYYASAGLLHMDLLLETLQLPVFVTGIDTILQRGVADLLQRSTDADVVLNKMGPHVLLGSQLVNNLVLTYPTANGIMFAKFLKFYLGGHLWEDEQPEFLDQLDLHMAKLHLSEIYRDSKIRYFEPDDINNDMFNRSNYIGYQARMRNYRFFNMFVDGCHGNSLTNEDLAGLELIEKTDERRPLNSAYEEADLVV